MEARMLMRMKKELEMLEKDPPHGITAWPIGDKLNLLEAVISGPTGTPYERGLFKLEISIQDRYPLEPPKVRFITPVYHPNIDNGGRICLDILSMPPKGRWTPSLNVSTVLTSIFCLLAEPNPEDGLMADITSEYKHNRSKFVETARNWTTKFATSNNKSSAVDDSDSSKLEAKVPKRTFTKDEEENNSDSEGKKQEKKEIRKPYQQQ